MMHYRFVSDGLLLMGGGCSIYEHDGTVVCCECERRLLVGTQFTIQRSNGKPICYGCQPFDIQASLFEDSEIAPQGRRKPTHVTAPGYTARDGTDREKILCKHCGGRGRVKKVLPKFTTEEKCVACGGLGHTIRKVVP